MLFFVYISWFFSVNLFSVIQQDVKKLYHGLSQIFFSVDEYENEWNSATASSKFKREISILSRSDDFNDFSCSFSNQYKLLPDY